LRERHPADFNIGDACFWCCSYTRVIDLRSSRTSARTDSPVRVALLHNSHGDSAFAFAHRAAFIRLSAPPTPSPQTTSTLNGSTLFSSIGCDLCHSPSLTTGASIFRSMGGVTYHPFSDFALHHMGSGLADGINQGAAGPDQFRTAPLWGLGQRLFFLHDGRTADVLQAIETHADCNGKIPDGNHDRFHPSKCSSEANGVINNFNALC